MLPVFFELLCLDSMKNMSVLLSVYSSINVYYRYSRHFFFNQDFVDSLSVSFLNLTSDIILSNHHTLYVFSIILGIVSTIFPGFLQFSYFRLFNSSLPSFIIYVGFFYIFLISSFSHLCFLQF